MAQSQQAKPSFKAPEGRYVQHSERGTGCSFVPSRPLRLTFATVQHTGGIHNYVLYNLLDTLAFCNYNAIDKVPLRQIVVGSTNASQVAYPTCHDHHPSVDGFDLVVGLSTGDVVVGSVKSQLQASSSNTKLLDLLHFNGENAVDPTRAVCVAWIPGSNAALFASAHQSGHIYLYQPIAAASTESSPRSGRVAGTVPRPFQTIGVCSGGLTSMAAAPDGSRLAATSKEGVLYVHDLATGSLLTGFRSHYGGLTCCAWSHDSQYIATGGEDDLVCVYGTMEQAVVFWGEGHTSWVTQVAFDRWESETSTSGSDVVGSLQQPPAEQTRYRIASVGQDCQLMLWDFVVEDGEFQGALDGLGSTSLQEKQDTYPGAVHRRTPSNPNVNGGHVPGNTLGAGLDPASRTAKGSQLPPEIQPPVKRSEIFVSTPVMAQMIHTEPCSDILFMKEAVYTGCFCGQVRCWRRPEKLLTDRSRQASLSVQSRQSSVTVEDRP